MSMNMQCGFASTNGLLFIFQHLLKDTLMDRPAYQLVFLSNKQLHNYPVKSSQVKKFYWHKFIHFYNNHEVTETQLGLFVTT